MTVNENNNYASITLWEDATVIYSHKQVGRPGLAVLSKFKDDLCIKNYQAGAAMREKYTNADLVVKASKSMVSCTIPTHTKDRVVISELEIESHVIGASHIGIVLKEQPPKRCEQRISEDYLGDYLIKEDLNITLLKKWEGTEFSDWLGCP